MNHKLLENELIGIIKIDMYALEKFFDFKQWQVDSFITAIGKEPKIEFNTLGIDELSVFYIPEFKDQDINITLLETTKDIGNYAYFIRYRARFLNADQYVIWKLSH